jgi:ABC-type antimicrobial peptide transport system permease subunit
MQVPVNSMGFVVRTDGTAAGGVVLPAIRDRISAADANLPLVRVRPMSAIVEASTGDTRMSSVLTSVFAVIAALLAAVGIYSLIAYSVAQRTREIGIRMALGADRPAVMRLIVGEGLVLAASGVLLGVAGSVLLTQTMTTMLYEVSPTDSGVLAMTCAGVLATAVLASLVPAIRALRVDPGIALRAE